MAVAEHRFIPSRARAINQQLRKAGLQSVWSNACQDQIAGGHAGVGVFSLDAVGLVKLCESLSQLVKGGVVHLFVIYGYQGAEEDSEKLQLTEKLLQAVLADSWVVCMHWSTFAHCR